jgi:hypothetical protein
MPTKKKASLTSSKLKSVKPAPRSKVTNVDEFRPWFEMNKSPKQKKSTELPKMDKMLGLQVDFFFYFNAYSQKNRELWVTVAEILQQRTEEKDWWWIGRLEGDDGWRGFSVSSSEKIIKLYALQMVFDVVALAFVFLDVEVREAAIRISTLDGKYRETIEIKR